MKSILLSTVLFITSCAKVELSTKNKKTAVLHLTSGTSAISTAPIKFTNGVLLYTVESGALDTGGILISTTENVQISHTNIKH